MTDDDAALRARLEALEAEVRADADAARARKDAALAKVREQRAREQAERQALRDRQAELHARRSRRSSAPPPDEDADHDAGAGLGGALELAQKAQGMRAELSRPRKAGEKSWVTSGALSLFFGPVGWLYAGSFREAIPAAAAWLALAALFTKVLPFFSFIMLPALLVALPVSGLVGVVYATNYNKQGKRTRLFGKDKKKQLKGGPKQLKG